MDYIDIATLHAYGGFQNPTEEGDALLETFISAASQAIDDHCRRRFAYDEAAGTVAVTYSSDNGLLHALGRVLWLHDDLCSVPTITGDPIVSFIPQTTPYDRIVLDIISYPWPDPTVIEGYWAYSQEPPAVIVQVCLRLAKWFYDQKESTDTDRAIVTPNGMVIMPAGLPKDVMILLDNYRRVGLP